MVDQHDTDIAVNKQVFIRFLHQNIDHHVQTGDIFTMTVKEWAEPTQQSNLATKETLTDIDDSADSYSTTEK